MMMTYAGTPKEIVPQMRELLANNQGFWLVVTGHSMTPTLRHLKDRVYISPFHGKAQKGDILLTTKGSHCLLHRVIACREDLLYYRGDAQKSPEGPLPIGDVIGIVTRIDQNAHVTRVNAFYRFRSALRLNVWRLKRRIIKSIRASVGA